jgi:flavodoxin
MRSVVVYSSQTGNTKKVAKAIFEILPDMKILCSIEDAPAIDDNDFLALGFWIDRGFPDAKAQRYMKTLRGKRIGLFGTLGSYHDIDYVVDCLTRAKKLLKNNSILGSFICQGKIAPEVLEMIAKTTPLTPEHWARIQEAEQHPNAEDLLNAQETFRTILTKL